jgi:hypothetical protein
LANELWHSHRQPAPSQLGISGPVATFAVAAQNLYNQTWGQPLEKLFRALQIGSSTLQYIPRETIERLGVHSLGFSEDVFLVRDEYIAAFDLMKNGYGRFQQTGGGVAIIGQPGVGKRCFPLTQFVIFTFTF